MVIGGALIFVSAAYWFLFKPPFPGVSSLGGGLLSDYCSVAEEKIGKLSSSKGFIFGRLRKAVYQKDKMYVILEAFDGREYSLMVIPAEFSDKMSKDYHEPRFNLYRLKYFYFSFCWEQNMFSTGVVVGQHRYGSYYQQIKDLVDSYISNGKVVAALIVNDRNNFVFDRSGTIFVHQLHFLSDEHD